MIILTLGEKSEIAIPRLPRHARQATEQMEIIVKKWTVIKPQKLEL